MTEFPFIIILASLLSNSCIPFEITRSREALDIFSLEGCDLNQCERKSSTNHGYCRCQCINTHSTFDPRIRRCIQDLSECNSAVFGNKADQVECVAIRGSDVLPITPIYRKVNGSTSRNVGHEFTCIGQNSLFLDKYAWRAFSGDSGFSIITQYDNVYLQWLGTDEDSKRITGSLVKIDMQCQSKTTTDTLQLCLIIKIEGTFQFDAAPTDIEDSSGGGFLAQNFEIAIIISVSVFGLACIIAVTALLVKRCRHSDKRKAQDKVYMIPVNKNKVHKSDQGTLNYVSLNGSHGNQLMNSTHTTGLSVPNPAMRLNPPLDDGRVYRKHIQDHTDITDSATPGTAKRKIRFREAAIYSDSSISDMEFDRPRQYPGILRSTGIIQLPADPSLKSSLVEFEGSRIEQPDEHAYIHRGIWGVQHSYLNNMNRSFHGIQELKASPPSGYHSDSELATRQATRSKSTFRKAIDYAISAFGSESERHLEEMDRTHINTGSSEKSLNHSPQSMQETLTLPAITEEEEKTSSASQLSNIEYGMFRLNQPQMNRRQESSMGILPTNQTRMPPYTNLHNNRLNGVLPPNKIIQNAKLLNNRNEYYQIPTGKIRDPGIVNDIPYKSPVYHNPNNTNGLSPFLQQKSNGYAPNSTTGDVFHSKTKNNNYNKSKPKQRSPEEPVWSKELFRKQSMSKLKSEPLCDVVNKHSSTQSPDGKMKQQSEHNSSRSRKTKHTPRKSSSPKTRPSIGYGYNNHDTGNNRSHSWSSDDDIPITLIDEALAAFPTDSEDDDVPVTNIDDCCYDETIEINPIYSTPIDKRTSMPRN